MTIIAVVPVILLPGARHPRSACICINFSSKSPNGWSPVVESDATFSQSPANCPAGKTKRTDRRIACREPPRFFQRKAVCSEESASFNLTPEV